MNTAAERLMEISRRRGRPRSVTFQVTNRCNYDCAHCYQEHGEDEELTLHEITDILKDLANEGIMMLTLVGGEFFVRRDADEILMAAHDLGFVVKLKTTGHHVHDRRADLIARLRPIHVDLSMYGADAGQHEAVTMQRGSYERTCAAAKRLLQRRVPVQLNVPVLEGTAHQLLELRQLGERLGARVSFTPQVSVMESGDERPARLRMTWETLGAFFTDPATAPLVNALAAHRHERTAPTCGAGVDVAGISPRGDLKPCHLLPISCGNLREHRFAELWTRPSEADQVRGLSYAALSECQTCALVPYCARCHAFALYEHGDLRGPSLEACRNAVALRDALKAQGKISPDDAALPPTWSRVDPDGWHRGSENTQTGHRSPLLRVIS